MAAGSGAMALSLVGCGGSNGSKSAGAGVTPAAQAPVDSTKGKPGGKLVVQGSGYPGTLVMVKTVNPTLAQLAGFTHSALLAYKNGRPIVPVTDVGVEPDLAQALPEQPDDRTYIFKLKQAKFQNGRAVTAEDVKYSYDRYAFNELSAYKTAWSWLDQVQTPDPQTVVVKTKYPFGDALQQMVGYGDAFVVAKEHEESSEAEKKLMGSGPFLFVDTTAPVVTHFKRNPDYFEKPYPYFDEVELLGVVDPAKKIADFSSRQVQHSYRFSAEERDQIRRNRPDAREFGHNFSAFNIFIRVDQPPFNDKRVRQALSMAIDRKPIRDGTSSGEGEPDQVLSIVQKSWGFRKPSELGAAAKYWNYDPQAAKQLLSAAGVTLPIETSMGHWDATVIGPAVPDTATLTASQWRTLGIANLKDLPQSIAQSTTTLSAGNFDGLYCYVNGMHNSPTFGITLRGQFFSPPEGVKAPTTNSGHVNDPQLSALVDKQVQQLKVEDRKQTFRQIEDLLAEEQYRIGYSTYNAFYFLDPSLQNAQIPRFIINGSIGYLKYWWFA